MRIRHLRIRVNTDKGLFGVDIPFNDGLFILRAENSMGKSTCLKAILVALGMEAVLTTRRDDLPLPPVLKEDLQTDEGRASVIESEIFVEIENRKGERIVVHRMVKGAQDAGLIEVTYGPALTTSLKFRSDQFFVGRPGDTTRDLGFLRFLLDFLGWDVPVVRTFKGDDRPLYPQCIMPFFFVEQSRGWATLEPPLPTWFGIKELHKRTVEYLLKLDAIANAAKRVEIEEIELSVERKWDTVVSSVQAIGRSAGGIVQRVPERPVTIWPPPIYPALMMPDGEDWIAIGEKQAELSGRLTEILNQEIPRVSEIVDSAELDLARVQECLSDRQALFSRLMEAYAIEKVVLVSTEERLIKIDEDLQRHKDTRTLLDLGGSAAKSIVDLQCPTCHQHIVDSLTPLAKGQSVMSIDENIEFLEEQRRIFRAVFLNQQNVVMARERQVTALKAEVIELRGETRALKATLVSDGRTPSLAAVRERVHLQESIENLERARDDFGTGLETLEELSETWKNLQLAKNQLPSDDTSINDKKKIARWGEILREQLEQYDFKSLVIDEITVSGESYRPLHDGFDLPTNISASDFIRVIWSYLNGLRELSLEFMTNHPGLLVFDEPRQQSAKDMSFEQLLKRAASSMQVGHQVIFATSEKEEVLQKMLEGVPHTYFAFSGHIIQRIKDE